MASYSPPGNVGLATWKTLLTPNSASIHLILYSTLLGSHLWHGFIGGPVTFKHLPRQTFGLLQSKLFPIFFGLGTVIPAALIGNLAIAQGSIGAVPAFPLRLLAVTLLTNAINWLYLGPKTSKIMFQRHELERAEGIDAYKDKDKASPEMNALSKKFAQLHGISSLLNLASFGALILHGSYLANFAF